LLSSELLSPLGAISSLASGAEGDASGGGAAEGFGAGSGIAVGDFGETRFFSAGFFFGADFFAEAFGADFFLADFCLAMRRTSDFLFSAAFPAFFLVLAFVAFFFAFFLLRAAILGLPAIVMRAERILSRKCDFASHSHGSRTGILTSDISCSPRLR
jgi:hypothetical protein